MHDGIRKYVQWIAAAGFSVLSIVLSMRYIGFVMFDPDPWIGIYGAKRILEGQLLYKNFFDFLTPGTDYLLAGIFHLFGLTLTAAQWTVVLSNALVVFLIVFVSFRIIKNRWLALLPGLLFALYAPYNYYVSHHWFILLPAMLVLLSGIRNIKEHGGRAWGWFFTGLATAAAFLFIQSIGLALFGMILLFIVWYYSGQHSRENGNPEFRSLSIPNQSTLKAPQVQTDNNNDNGQPGLGKSYEKGILSKSGIFYIAGFLIPITVVIALFFLSGSLHAFIYDSFVWPFLHYGVINVSTPRDILKLLMKELSDEGITMGLIYAFTAYFGIMLSFIVLVYAAKKTREHKTTGLSLVAFISLFCTGIMLGLLPNPPAFHLMVFLPVYMLSVIIIFEYTPFWSSRLVRAGFYFYFISITIVFSYNALRFLRAYERPINAVEVFQTPIGKVKMFKAYKNLPSISYPYSLLKNQGIKLPKFIFVFYWSPSVYLLTGTDNPAPLDTYVPFYNTREQARSVIRALQANHTEIVIRDNTPAFIKRQIGWLVHNPDIFSDHDPLLSYIHAHYRLEKTIPGYKIYQLVQ